MYAVASDLSLSSPHRTCILVLLWDTGLCKPLFLSCSFKISSSWQLVCVFFLSFFPYISFWKYLVEFCFPCWDDDSGASPGWRMRIELLQSPKLLQMLTDTGKCHWKYCLDISMKVIVFLLLIFLRTALHSLLSSSVNKIRKKNSHGVFHCGKSMKWPLTCI